MYFYKAPGTYSTGDLILELGDIATYEEDPRRIQVDQNHFILPPALLYHSCEPNAYIDWQKMQLLALRPISFDEIITYHYGTSEDDYSIGAFECTCGYSNCVGDFQGFRFMTDTQRVLIARYISPYLKEKYL